MSEEYNGWSNYETWLVNVHLSNDEGLYHATLELADWHDEANDLAEAIEEFVKELLAQSPCDSVFHNEVGRISLFRVDWIEIAESWKEEN